MKPIQIIAVDDERTSVPFSIPVKGRRPLVLRLPRFDFINEDDFDGLTESLAALDKEEMSLRKRTRAVALTMMKPFVGEKEYAALQSLAAGQLDQILELWRERSQVSLGESEASDNSSTESMEAQSSTTSSSADSTVETSDTPSDGQS